MGFSQLEDSREMGAYGDPRDADGSWALASIGEGGEQDEAHVRGGERGCHHSGLWSINPHGGDSALGKHGFSAPDDALCD